MKQWHLALITVIMIGALGWACAAEQLTPPSESLGGLRPGSLTLTDMEDRYGPADIEADEGLLGLYGGAQESHAYGWYMVDNPNYVVPDLAVETPQGSNRVDLVMVIGYDGIGTEKGATCFQSDTELVKAYGRPDFVFAVPMQGGELREFYYVNQGISFDVAPVGENGGRQIIAIYVTYPEYLKRAVEIRRELIKDGTGNDITSTYTGSRAA